MHKITLIRDDDSSEFTRLPSGDYHVEHNSPAGDYTLSGQDALAEVLAAVLECYDWGGHKKP